MSTKVVSQLRTPYPKIQGLSEVWAWGGQKINENGAKIIEIRMKFIKNNLILAGEGQGRVGRGGGQNCLISMNLIWISMILAPFSLILWPPQAHPSLRPCILG